MINHTEYVYDVPALNYFVSLPPQWKPTPILGSFRSSGVEHVQHNQDQFRFRRAPFYYSQLKSKVGNIPQPCVSTSMALLMIASRIVTRTHPNHKLLASNSLPSP
jgi:hypothetical protein